jgi:hypothetical protein
MDGCRSVLGLASVTVAAHRRARGGPRNTGAVAQWRRWLDVNKQPLPRLRAAALPGLGAVANSLKRAFDEVDAQLTKWINHAQLAA